jgi:transmembrane sensor
MNTPADKEEGATIEAARWLVALDEAPDDRDLRVRFQAWLDASPANAAAWADACDVYGLMTKTEPVHCLQWERALRPAVLRRPSRRRLAWAAAAGVLAACLAIVAGPDLVSRLQADQITATAEVRTLDLEDGSVVRLAPDSAVDVAYGAGRRQVRLLRGEAFFEVKSDAARPFRVAASGVDVTVLGTAFNVRLAGQGVEVAVQRGLVQVDEATVRPPIAERLRPGEWVRVGKNGPLERGAIPPEEVAPWLHGQIVARDRPMADVVDELRRYYAGLIVVADGTLAGRRVTGVYNLSDPAAALRAIVAAHGGSVRRVSPWLLVAF